MVITARFPSIEQGLSLHSDQGPLESSALAQVLGQGLQDGQPVVLFVPGHGRSPDAVSDQAAALSERLGAAVIAFAYDGGGNPGAATAVEAGRQARANAFGLLELLATLLHTEGLRELWAGRAVSLVVHGLGARILKAAVLERPDLVGEVCTSVVLAAADISYELQIDWLARLTPRQEPDAVGVLWHDGDAALDNILDGRLLRAARGEKVPPDLLETQVGVFGDTDPFHAVPEFEYVDVSEWVGAGEAEPWPADALHLDDGELLAIDQQRASAASQAFHTYLWSSREAGLVDTLGRLIRKGGTW